MFKGKKDELLGADEKRTEQECHPEKQSLVFPYPVEIEGVDYDERPREPHDTAIIGKRCIFQEHNRR